MPVRIGGVFHSGGLAMSGADIHSPIAVVCVSSAVQSNTGCGPARDPLVLSE